MRLKPRSLLNLIKFDNFRMHKRFLTPGMAVLDCGCSPGAWSQVASVAINADGQYSERTPSGKLIGIDLLYMETINGVHFIQVI